MKPKALIFDFDGTLAVLNIDFNLMKERVAALAARLGLAGPFPAGYLLEAVDEAAAVLGPGFKTAAWGLIQEMEVAAAAQSSLFPFTLPLLADLRAAGLKLAIITRNCAPAVKVLLPAIDELVDAFIPRELASRPKPHPDQVLAACAALGAPPTLSVMVGDHPTDMQAAVAAGAFALGVASGRAPAEELTLAGARLVLPDASGLLASQPLTLGLSPDPAHPADGSPRAPAPPA